MANLYLDIELSNIPKDRIRTTPSGKKYLKAIIRPRKEVDRDGYDHYIAVFVPRDERVQGVGPTFIGRAQLKPEYEEQPAKPVPQIQEEPTAAEEQTDDLPF